MNHNAEYLNELVATLNSDIVDELLEIYFSQMHDTIEKYFKLLKCFNGDEVIYLSHKMKSSSRNIGANELAELFSQFEKDPKSLTEDAFNKVTELFAKYQFSVSEWRLLHSA